MQVERFDELPEAVLDHIAAFTDGPVGDMPISWAFKQGDHDLTAVPTDFRRWADRAAFAAARRDSARLAALRVMSSAGLSYRDIAELVGTSHQRVGQILAEAGKFAQLSALPSGRIVSWLRARAPRGRTACSDRASLPLVESMEDALSPTEEALALFLDGVLREPPADRAPLLAAAARLVRQAAQDDLLHRALDEHATRGWRSHGGRRGT